MFSIEHEFDATLVTLMDEGQTKLREDIIIRASETSVHVEQYDPDTDSVQCVTLSMHQLKDLRAALNLPEGVYQLQERGTNA